jgi:hypothetical protein
VIALSRNPKPDAQQPGTADDAGVDQVFVVDIDGGAMLVAQASAVRAELAAAADNPNFDDAGAPEAVDGLYEGHVPLVLDDLELASVDATFDSLTNSADLFDVPALDAPAAADGASGE